MTLGSFGSMTMSPTPVESFLKKIFCHVLPPSFDRNTPRSGFGAQMWPSAPTYTRSGFVGCTAMSVIWRVSPSPMNAHVLPPSVVFQTPSPCETLPRIGNSPPPTYTTSGADGATLIAPIVPPKYLSVTGAHDWPALIVLKTPPPGVPIQNSSGRDGLPAAAAERPPRNGPTSRQCTPANVSESVAVTVCDRAALDIATEAASMMNNDL